MRLGDLEEDGVGHAGFPRLTMVPARRSACSAPATIPAMTSAAGRMPWIIPRPWPAKPPQISARPAAMPATVTAVETAPCKGIGSGSSPASA